MTSDRVSLTVPCRASSPWVQRIEFGWSDTAMENIANTNIPDRPEGTPMDKRINPEPDSKERGEKIADEIAHKGAQREHEYDDQQKPFNK
jgi:hypothetical protein